MAATSAWEIVAIFAVMFMGITIATLWFPYSSSKVESRKELQQRKMEIVDKHFHEMTGIECPNCRANTKKILFPEMPE